MSPGSYSPGWHPETSILSDKGTRRSQEAPLTLEAPWLASQSPNQPQPPHAAPAVLVVMPPAEPEPPPAPIWSPWGLIPTWGSLFMAAAKWWPGGSHRFISLPAKRCKASRYSTFGQEHGPFGDIFSWKSSFKAASPLRESLLLHPMFAGVLNTHPRPTPKLCVG